MSLFHSLPSFFFFFFLCQICKSSTAPCFGCDFSLCKSLIHSSFQRQSRSLWLQREFISNSSCVHGHVWVCVGVYLCFCVSGHRDVSVCDHLCVPTCFSDCVSKNTHDVGCVPLRLYCRPMFLSMHFLDYVYANGRVHCTVGTWISCKGQSPAKTPCGLTRCSHLCLRVGQHLLRRASLTSGMNQWIPSNKMFHCVGAILPGKSRSLQGGVRSPLHADNR